MKTSMVAASLLILLTNLGCGANASKDAAHAGGSGGNAGSTASTGGVAGNDATGGRESNGGVTNLGGSAGQPASGGKPAACTPGADQTCNDDPRVSSLWGRCENGVCRCGAEREVNPTTGKCRIATAATITLARSLCFGGCPVYSVRLDADGTVSYVGQRYVRVQGAASRSIEPSAVAALADEMEAFGYFDVAIPDDCDEGISTDAPTVITSLTRGTRAHEVSHYLGNNCAPQGLRELEARIDEVAGTAEWVECSPNPFCQEP